MIRFGSSDPTSKTGPAAAVGFCIYEKEKRTHFVRSPIWFLLVCVQIQELEVARPLILSERAVAVALAISLDNDYFSRHGGW